MACVFVGGFGVQFRSCLHVAAAIVDVVGGDAPVFFGGDFAVLHPECLACAGQAVALAGQGEHQGAQVEKVTPEAGLLVQRGESFQGAFRVDRLHPHSGPPLDRVAVGVGGQSQGESACEPGGCAAVACLAGRSCQAGEVERGVEHHQRGRFAVDPLTPAVPVGHAVDPLLDELAAGVQP